jgi:hypothetical protein
MGNLETMDKESNVNAEVDGIKYPSDVYGTSFAEQYLEKPVAEGKYAIQSGVSVTFCTFRGVPLLDDY